MNRPLSVRLLAVLCVLLCVAACGGRSPRQEMDLSLRARVDNMNKLAFVNRYRDPLCAIEEGYAALALLNDSLPDYHDGRLRAYNNLAFDYYMLAEHDSASAYIDSVLYWTSLQKSDNDEVERVIARLLQVRLLQRGCRIADSYRLLYGISRDGIPQRRARVGSGNAYLYDFARMEYYITSLTLNYHYRNGAVASSSGTALSAATMDNMQALLGAVETALPDLRCDYAEDLALRYAIAHACYRMAAVQQDHVPMLRKAFAYLDRSQQILNTPQGYCDYHQANVYQLRAFIGADTALGRVAEAIHDSCQGMPVGEEEVLRLFRLSTEMFFATPDPYQHLGAVVAAAEYCLRIGDLDEARFYYTLALEDSSWSDGMAPKFESMLYDGLIRMPYSLAADDQARWYAREMELLEFIRGNERADSLLQEQLERSQSRNHVYVLAIAVGSLLLIVLAVLVFLLRHRTKILHNETRALQEAKRQDVERIANVETCLSVLRHDINPFLSYLQNKKLSEELRQEVLEQLLRTFANIKNWTNLSIPSGLQFRRSEFPLDEVFESVRATSVNLRPAQVVLQFHPSELTVDGDRQLVEILLRNLVNNALRCTEAGSVTVSATVADDPRFVHITVSDTGCGMDADTLENLFRADKTPSSGGHGFGLILCKYIIKRHDDNTLRGCRIWAESTPGEGTTMHLLLAAHNY